MPDRQRIRLERSAIREDLTIGQVPVENRDHARALHDPSQVTATATRARDVARPLRQALHVRAVSVVVSLVLGHRSARPRLDLASRRAGHRVTPAERHRPVSSGRPSAVRGAGAERFGLPSAVRGIPGVASVSHCADANGVADANKTNVASGRFMLAAEARRYD